MVRSWLRETSAAARRALWRRRTSASTLGSSTWRWGMRYHSVSRTRAGPIATPAETGMPRLISMPVRPRGAARAAPSGLALRGRGLIPLLVRTGRRFQGVAQRRQGVGGVLAGHFQDQLRPRFGGQQEQVELTLAVDAALAAADGDGAAELAGQLGERRRGSHVQTLGVVDRDDPLQRFTVHD